MQFIHELQHPELLLVPVWQDVLQFPELSTGMLRNELCLATAMTSNVDGCRICSNLTRLSLARSIHLGFYPWHLLIEGFSTGRRLAEVLRPWSAGSSCR
jgi:hypothetical protein